MEINVLQRQEVQRRSFINLPYENHRTKTIDRAPRCAFCRTRGGMADLCKRVCRLLKKVSRAEGVVSTEKDDGG